MRWRFAISDLNIIIVIFDPALLYIYLGWCFFHPLYIQVPDSFCNPSLFPCGFHLLYFHILFTDSIPQSSYFIQSNPKLLSMHSICWYVLYCCIAVHDTGLLYSCWSAFASHRCGRSLPGASTPIKRGLLCGHFARLSLTCTRSVRKTFHLSFHLRQHRTMASTWVWYVCTCSQA